MEILGNFLYFGLFYIILAGIILSYCGKRNGDTEMLGKEAGKEFRGFAILMVLLGHLYIMMGYVQLPVTMALGAPAVDMFLFLSAFGLMHSYSAKGLKGFIGRRLAIILIPYSITTLLKFLLIPLEAWTFKLLFINILPLSIHFGENIDSSMWYVQYILLCYAVFFIIFAIPKLEKKWKVLILSVIGLGLSVYFGTRYYQGTITYMTTLAESYSHYLSFPLGAAFYLVYEKAKKLSYKAYIPIGLAAFVIFQFIVFPGSDDYVKYYINNLCYIVFFIAVFKILKHFGFASKPMQWLGDMSYYIYLNELIVISQFYQYVKLPNGINGLLIIITSIAAAVPVKYFCEWLLKKIKVK